MSDVNQQAGRKSWLIWSAKLVFRLTVLTLVAWGIWRTVARAHDDFQRQQTDLNARVTQLQLELAEEEARDEPSPAELTSIRAELERLEDQRFSLWEIDPWWLLLAGCAYLLGSAPCWLFWHRTLWAMGQRPKPRETLRAFYIGHLGKYVPGKALVVILRTALIRSKRVDTTVAATSVFVETLTMMAVGAAMAAAILAAVYREDSRLLVLAVVLMICAGAPTAPPIFRRLVRILQVKRANPNIDKAIDGLSFQLMMTGWCAIAIGWVLLGLSLWATLRALPGPSVAGPEHLPLLIACTALAMVAGFLSLIPGGAGVRELVVMSLLTPAFGEVTAVVAAVLLRVVWMVSEVVFSGILYVMVRGPDQQPPATPTPPDPAPPD